MSIGGRPGVGKTAYSSALLRGIIKNNDISEIEILDFNWEMAAKSLLIRDLSAEMRMTYGDIISADDDRKLSDDKMTEVKETYSKYRKLPWHFEETPRTTAQFADIIERRVTADPKKKRIVRIDHSILAKQAATEASQVIMLQNLLGECVKLKKQSDIIFLVLTQIGRDFEERQEDRTDRAYPKKSDPFGGDAVAQSSEIVLLLNKPSEYGVTYYGNSGKGAVVEDNDIFAHLVKNRNNEGNLIFHYKEDFKHMKITEW
jgi:replicative DNA helicase